MNRTLPLAPLPRQLIINADDLGVSAARDAGILDCFAAGAISSASLLVDGANAAAAAAAATAAGLPLGLHLNLTEGPLPAPNSLTDGDGQRLGKLGLRAVLAAGRVTRKDIAGEIRRQFERFIDLTGELPSHVDGHHPIHVEALVAEVLAPIMAREYGVHCVRLPREADLDTLPGDAEYEADFQRGVVRSAQAAEAVFAAAGLYSTGAFLGQSTMGMRLTANGMASRLATLTGHGAVELMVHPGRSTDDLQFGPFCRSPARAHEAALLQSAGFAAARAGWTLASYRELRRPQEDGRPNLLLYGKLMPGTGNAETARRYAAAWAAQANVRFRPLPTDESPAGLAREAIRLQELARRERLDVAIGIHLLRAGRPLAAAFATDTAAPLAYGLLASGTDANADIEG
ncbi:MAG: ChbG/HpnK family deacetylase, partial [Rhodocyclaceae bacterium]